MKRLALFTLVVVALTSLATAGMAANWYSLGNTGYSMPGGTGTWANDYNRIKYTDVMADAAGNVYVAQNVAIGTQQRGAVTVYKTDGTTSSYLLGSGDVATKDFGAVTKLVKGGDGNVYLGMNYTEINYSTTWQREAICKLSPTGYTEVYSPGAFSQANHIQGIAVGGDGNIYFTMNGADAYWKNHFFWRYDVASGQVEEAPQNAAGATGWGQYHQWQDLVYVGGATAENPGGWFGVIHRSGAAWDLSAMSWTNNRRGAVNNVSNPTWARKQSTDINYDPINNRVWAGARGDANHAVSSRWNGDDLDGLFDPEAIADPMPGIANSNMWHSPQDMDMGVNWWVSAQDINPTNGDWWYSVKGANDSSSLGNWRGKVLRAGADPGAVIDEGTPEAWADVVGLGFANGGTYALVWSRMDNTYELYTTVPEPTSLIALGTGLIGILGIVRRRK